MKMLDPRFWKPNHWGDSWGTWQGAQEQVMIGKSGALLCDPTYICDYFNEANNPDTRHISQTAILFWDDHGGAVYEGPLGILIGDIEPGPDWRLIQDSIGGDSGALMLLPWGDSVPTSIANTARDLANNENAAILKIRPGIYRPYCTKENDLISILGRS